LRQEVVINKVVRGDKSLEGMTAKLDVSNGLVYYNIDEKRDPFDPRGFNLYYTNTVNIMQPATNICFFNRMPCRIMQRMILSLIVLVRNIVILIYPCLKMTSYN